MFRKIFQISFLLILFTIFIQIYNPIHISIRKKSSISSTENIAQAQCVSRGYPFGGFFVPFGSGCNHANPITGNCSCPAGYTAWQFDSGGTPNGAAMWCAANDYTVN